MENNELNTVIRNRYSPRAFSSLPLSEEEITSLFEAARWAASARNLQPWRFIYATPKNKERWEKLFDCLIEFNQEWVNSAPFLMLVLAQKIDPERSTERKNVSYDLGLAMGNFTTQAGHLGIYLRNMAGFSTEKAISHFNIPSIYEPVVMVAVGHLGDEDQLNEKLKVPKGKNRVRRTLDQIIFEDDWNKMQ
jgi:nitroreductase